MTTRQYARLLSEWIASIGLDPHLFGTHSLRRTKATLIYRRTGNLRAVQLLLGHTKIESTVRYLGIEVDDALSIAGTGGPLISRAERSVPPEHRAPRNEPCCPGGEVQLADILQNRPKAGPLGTAVWLLARTSSAWGVRDARRAGSGPEAVPYWSRLRSRR
jgi:hypothetical protein